MSQAIMPNLRADPEIPSFRRRDYGEVVDETIAALAATRNPYFRRRDYGHIPRPVQVLYDRPEIPSFRRRDYGNLYWQSGLPSPKDA